LFWEFFS